MMNGVALFLILTSFLSGTVWPPTLQEKSPVPNVIEKEGPVEVVVEYNTEGEDINTKVSISLKHHNPHNIEEKMDIRRSPNSREFVSDKFNKKVEETKEGFSKGVDKVKEYGGELSHKVKDTVEKVKDGDMMDTAKRWVEDVASNLSSYVENIKERPLADMAKMAIEDVDSNMSSYVGKIKESNLVVMPKRATEDVWGNVTSYAGKLKESDTPRRAVEDIWGNKTRAIEFVHRFLRRKVCKVEEKGKHMTDWGKNAIDTNSVTKIVKSGEQFVMDAVKDGAHMAREMEGKATDHLMEGEERATKGMNSTIKVVHLLAFSMALGMSVWVTLFSSYILQDALPGEQFGMVRSKLYPIYFRIQAYSIGITLITYLLSHGRMVFSNRMELLYAINMTISLLTSLANSLCLEPYSTKLMHQRLKLEKDAGRGGITSNPTSGIAGDPVSATRDKQEEVGDETETADLHKKINKLNRISNYGNTATIISLALHMMYLGFTI